MKEKRQTGSSRMAVLMTLSLLLAMVCFATPVWADEGAENDEAVEDVEEAAPEEQRRRVDGPTPRLFLIPTDGLLGEISQIVTERISDALRRQLDGDRRIDVVPTFQELRLAADDGGYGAISEAERQYTSAIGLLQAGEYERAAEVFQRALDLIEENLPALQNYNILAHTLSNISRAYFEAGFDLDSRRYMQRFAQLRPTATLDPDEFPQELRTIFDDEIDRVQRAETGILHIEVDRPQALVFIDGALRGAAPLTVEDVGFGHHYLVVRDGETAWSSIIQVRARGQEQTFEVELDAVGDDDEDSALPGFYVDLRENFQTGRFGAELSPYFTELINQTGADFIAWTLVVRERNQYVTAPFVYRASDGLLIQGENVTFNLEISNLRAGVSRLAAIISMAVANMPEDLAVQDVDLLYEPEPEPVAEVVVPEEEREVTEPVAEIEPEEEPQEDREEAVAHVDEPTEALPVPGRTPPEREGIRDPIIDDDGRERNNRMLYVGLGSVAGGALLGTIIYLVRASGSPDPTGFEAEVEW